MCPDRICIGSAVSLERAGSTGSKVNVYISSKVWKCTPHTSSWQLSRQAPLLWLSTMVGPHRRDPILNLSGASGGGRQAQLPSVPCRPRAPAGDTMSDGTQSDGNGIAWGMGWMGGERASEHGEKKKAHHSTCGLPHECPLYSSPSHHLASLSHSTLGGVSTPAGRESLVVLMRLRRRKLMRLNEGTIAIITQHIMSLLSRCFLVACVVYYFFSDARRMGLPAREHMDDRTHDPTPLGKAAGNGRPYDNGDI